MSGKLPTRQGKSMAKRRVRSSRNKTQISPMRLILLFNRDEEVGWTETGSFSWQHLLLAADLSPEADSGRCSNGFKVRDSTPTKTGSGAFLSIRALDGDERGKELRQRLRVSYHAFQVVQSISSKGSKHSPNAPAFFSQIGKLPACHCLSVLLDTDMDAHTNGH